VKRAAEKDAVHTHARMQAFQPPATMIGMYRDRGRAVLFRSGEGRKQTTRRKRFDINPVSV